MRVREPGLVLGRNYVETLILTFEQYQLLSPDLGVQEYVVVRLEEVLCSIAYTLPHVKNIYHNKIWSILHELYPDLPRPDLGSCFAFHAVRKWLDDNKTHIIKVDPSLGLVPIDALQERILEQTIHIVRTAIIATFVETGIIKL